MSTEQIIRAWKDANYRQSLSEEEQALVPAHPAGTIELDASTLMPVSEEAPLEGTFTGEPCTGDETCPLW